MFAKDSNHENADTGYQKQLDRYYTTITTGIDKDGKKSFQCDNVFVFFLTYIRQPEPTSILRGILWYGIELREWLYECLKLSIEKVFLKEFIQQYLNLINKMTNNYLTENEKRQLKEKVAVNWESTKCLIDNFKHVKWYSVYEFWQTLKSELEKHYKNAEIFPKEDLDFKNIIAKVTHQNKNENHGILFQIKDGTTAYISGENNLSWGIVSPKKWADFENENLQDIRFSDFSTDNTFRLINRANMEKAVSEIIRELENNYENLHE